MSQRTYSPAVAKRRQELLRSRPIHTIAQQIGIHDSQIVRLLNGGKANPSYRLVRNLAATLDYRSSDEFYEQLEALWKTMARQNQRAA